MDEHVIPTTTLGRTGLIVSRMGLGLAALGRPGYLVVGHGEDLGQDRSAAALQDRAHRILDLAVDHGITYIDVARSYGRAEAFVSTWQPARSVTIGSKWGYTYTADWQVEADVQEVKDHSATNFRRQRALTDDLLGTRLGLYQVHSATLGSGILDDDEVLDELRAQGVPVGLSLSGPDQAATLRKAMAIPDTPFTCVQATWNVLEPSVGPTLAEAHDAGWGVIVKEALANGRLTSRGDTALAGPGTPDALALAAVLAQPFVDVVLSGAAMEEHLRSNLAAFSIDPRALPLVRAEHPQAYWARRSSMSWT